MSVESHVICLKKMIEKELNKQNIEVTEIIYSKIENRLYLLIIICTEKTGKIKLKKSTIKHIAKNNTEGNIPLKYLVNHDIRWSA